MIKEWLRNIRMNYASEQTYIAQRMLQEQGGWQSHLNNSKKFIEEFIKERPLKSINILGSGWLLDVPMDSIIEQFDRIVLTDIYHPKQIISKYSNQSNVEFHTMDLTNGVVDLTYSMKKRSFNFEDYIRRINSIRPFNYKENIVVSVNLLSQLSVFITNYLSKKVALNNNQLEEIASAIQLNHLKSLPQNKSLVITDYEEEFIDENDKLMGSKPTIFIDIPKNKQTKEWIWKFDSLMTYREDCKTNLKVIASRM